MKSEFTFVPNISEQVSIPVDGILSHTLYDDEQVKAILFGFDRGQELSEHTASMGAILHIIKGEVRLTLGDEDMAARAGTWVHMPPRLPHSVYAETQAVMLLLLIRAEKQGTT